MFLDRGKKLLLFALLQPAPLWAETAEDWVSRGKASLQAALKLEAKHAKAKNVILFVGDGMGISTITAARIFAGQKQGLDGEAYQLAFEKTALSGPFQKPILPTSKHRILRQPCQQW